MSRCVPAHFDVAVSKNSPLPFFLQPPIVAAAADSIFSTSQHNMCCCPPPWRQRTFVNAIGRLIVVATLNPVTLTLAHCPAGQSQNMDFRNRRGRTAFTCGDDARCSRVCQLRGTVQDAAPQHRAIKAARAQKVVALIQVGTVNHSATSQPANTHTSQRNRMYCHCTPLICWRQNKIHGGAIRWPGISLS
jgi:hypothetical protein